jgi:hypothetical protein
MHAQSSFPNCAASRHRFWRRCDLYSASTAALLQIHPVARAVDETRQNADSRAEPQRCLASSVRLFAPYWVSSFTVKRKRRLMNVLILAMTRCPARSLHTYTLQSSAYRTNRYPRCASSHQFIKHDVAQQRRQRPTLRHTLLRCHHHTVGHHHLGVEHLPDQHQQSLVRYPD